MWFRRKRLRFPNGIPRTQKYIAGEPYNGTFTLSFKNDNGLWETTADIPHDADIETISLFLGELDWKQKLADVFGAAWAVNELEYYG